MKTLKLPESQVEWERLAAVLVRANLELADMSQIDLREELAALGIDQSTKNISGKLRHGRFSATFFLQALVAMGVEQLQLPQGPRHPKRPRPILASTDA